MPWNPSWEVTVDVRRLPRVRHLALALLAAVGLVVAVAAPSSASPEWSPPTYLALGDSVPFGFHNSPFTVGSPEWFTYYTDPAAFSSYANDVARDRHLRLLNASCPGETTGSYQDPAKEIYKCEGPTGYRTLFPLHVDYGMKAQQKYADRVLRNPANRVQLVTLQLGANDAFLCQATPSCDVTAEAAVVHQNLGAILDNLRSTGYRGRIVVVDYYAVDYSDPVGVQGTLLLDRAIDTAALTHHATVASGFLAFAPRALAHGGSSITAGLVYPNDVHPTPAGHRLLARAVEFAAR